MSPTVAHPHKTVRATATSLRANAPQSYAAQQPNNAWQQREIARNSRGSLLPLRARATSATAPLRDAKAVAPSLARASRSERAARGSGCAPLMLRFAGPRPIVHCPPDQRRL